MGRAWSRRGGRTPLHRRRAVKVSSPPSWDRAATAPSRARSGSSRCWRVKISRSRRARSSGRADGERPRAAGPAASSTITSAARSISARMRIESRAQLAAALRRRAAAAREPGVDRADGCRDPSGRQLRQLVAAAAGGEIGDRAGGGGVGHAGPGRGGPHRVAGEPRLAAHLAGPAEHAPDRSPARRRPGGSPTPGAHRRGTMIGPRSTVSSISTITSSGGPSSARTITNAASTPPAPEQKVLAPSRRSASSSAETAAGAPSPGPGSAPQTPRMRSPPRTAPSSRSRGSGGAATRDPLDGVQVPVEDPADRAGGRRDLDAAAATRRSATGGSRRAPER